MNKVGEVPEEEQTVSECESDLLTQAEHGNETTGSGCSNQAVRGEREANDLIATQSTIDMDTTAITDTTITSIAYDGPADSTNPDFELREATSCSDSDSDGSSYSTDDDDDDDIDVGDQGLSLMEKRNRNVQRHRDVLDRLDLAHGISIVREPKKGARTKKSSGDLDTPNVNGDGADAVNGMNRPHAQRPNGMLLFPGGCLDHRRAVRGQFPRLDRDEETGDALTLPKLCEIYPHRENLIRKLRDVLSVPLIGANAVAPDASGGQHRKANAQNSAFCASPPIFITGPSGCGKTAIVQDVLDHVVNQCAHGSAAARAYVDCRTLDVFSMEEFVVDVQGQFAMQFLSSSSKRSRQRQVASPEKNASMLKDQRLCNTRTNDTVEPTTTTTAREPIRHRRTSGSNHQGTNTNQEPSTKAKYASRQSKRSRAQLEPGDQGEWPLNETQGQRMTAPMLAAWTLGCALERWQRRGVRGGGPAQAAFLVIDNAERLLSFAGSSRHKTAAAAENVNFLAQLLLLPRVLQLNLTIMVITKSVLLEHISKFINRDSQRYPFSPAHAAFSLSTSTKQRVV
jgi:hypothetical protein